MYNKSKPLDTLWLLLIDIFCACITILLGALVVMERQEIDWVSTMYLMSFGGPFIGLFAWIGHRPPENPQGRHKAGVSLEAVKRIRTRHRRLPDRAVSFFGIGLLIFIYWLISFTILIALHIPTGLAALYGFIGILSVFVLLQCVGSGIEMCWIIPAISISSLLMLIATICGVGYYAMIGKTQALIALPKLIIACISVPTILYLLDWTRIVLVKLNIIERWEDY